MKHQHAEQIHAFADGKAIQYRKRIRTGPPPPWEDIDKPSWLEDFEYRVKPVTVYALSDDASIALMKKVGQLTQANYDLRTESEEANGEINRLTKEKENLRDVLLEKEGIIKCIDNSNTILTKESREYRQTNADLHNEVEHLKKQNEHLQWAHDTAQACRARTQEQVDELQSLLDGCMRDKQAIASHFRQKITDLEHKLLHAERAYAGVCLQHAEVSGRLNAYEKEFGSDCVSAQADASADADAQVFGADVIISIQFPPQEKL